MKNKCIYHKKVGNACRREFFFLLLQQNINFYDIV